MNYVDLDHKNRTIRHGCSALDSCRSGKKDNSFDETNRPKTDSDGKERGNGTEVQPST